MQVNLVGEEVTRGDLAQRVIPANRTKRSRIRRRAHSESIASYRLGTIQELTLVPCKSPSLDEIFRGLPICSRGSCLKLSFAYLILEWLYTNSHVLPDSLRVRRFESCCLHLGCASKGVITLTSSPSQVPPLLSKGIGKVLCNARIVAK